MSESTTVYHLKHTNQALQTLCYWIRYTFNTCQVFSGGSSSQKGGHVFAEQCQSCLWVDDDIRRCSDSGGRPPRRSDCMSLTLWEVGCISMTIK